jgi:hypothetical protein
LDQEKSANHGWATFRAIFSQTHFVTLPRDEVKLQKLAAVLYQRFNLLPGLASGVARFFLTQYTKTGKIYKMTTI